MAKMDCSNTPGIIICGNLYTYSAEEKKSAQEHIDACPACNKIAHKAMKDYGRLPYGIHPSRVMFEIYDTGKGPARYNVKVVDGSREFDCGLQDGEVVKFLKSISRYQGGTIYAMI